MARELAFALINPYTIAKSRTGGVISRLTSRSGLDLVGARMFGPSRELAERYAETIRSRDEGDPETRALLADYVKNSYGPDPRTGQPRRVLMLLFEGEDAIAKIERAAGNVRYNTGSAETVRDTYGDFIVDEAGKVRYVEPAILIGPSRRCAEEALKLWASYSESDGGLIGQATDVRKDVPIQKTLVLIKPDNFRFPSGRPGNIIDLFSGSGLRIIGAKVHRMSVAEAEEFYGPVRLILRDKLKGKVAEMARKALSTELAVTIPDETLKMLGDSLGPLYGDAQFHQIVRFMTGVEPVGCPEEAKNQPGRDRCLALVYAGPDAVNRIRGILGPTDPSKAQPGSVRREFGQDIMVNAAHASDSPESAERELGIIKVEKDNIREWVEKYYP